MRFVCWIMAISRLDWFPNRLPRQSSLSSSLILGFFTTRTCRPFRDSPSWRNSPSNALLEISCRIRRCCCKTSCENSNGVVLGKLDAALELQNFTDHSVTAKRPHVVKNHVLLYAAWATLFLFYGCFYCRLLASSAWQIAIGYMTTLVGPIAYPQAGAYYLS